jgi:hypothetical protein
MRPLVAHCHLGLGKLYRRTGKREQAQEHLTTATTMYREMGMTYWLEKAEAELRVGERVKFSLLDDLPEFVHDHRPHGSVTADATPPEWNGYRLTVACSCGVIFEQWITPWAAELDLLRLARLN